LLTTSSSIMVRRSVSELGKAGSYEGNPTVGALDTDMPWIGDGERRGVPSIVGDTSKKTVEIGEH